MSAERLGQSMKMAWFTALLSVAVAISFSIEHPEYLSMPLIPFALLMSLILIGVPYGFGLIAIQGPVFTRVLNRSGSRKKAWLASFVANAMYAAALGVLVGFISALLNAETANLIWASFVFSLMSVCTSLLLLVCHEAVTRRAFRA